MNRVSGQLIAPAIGNGIQAADKSESGDGQERAKPPTPSRHTRSMLTSCHRFRHDLILGWVLRAAAVRVAPLAMPASHAASEGCADPV